MPSISVCRLVVVLLLWVGWVCPVDNLPFAVGDDKISGAKNKEQPSDRRLENDAASPQLQRARRLIAEGRRQLFLDDMMIQRVDGLQRVVHQPQKYAGNPVVRVDQTPWQTYRAQLYGTVLYDPQDNLFRMWYLSGASLPFKDSIFVDGEKRIPNFQLVGYGESKDGFHWTLPNLGLVNYNGLNENNICRIARTNAEGIAVIRDPRDPDPDRRYKAFYWEHASGNSAIPDISVNGMSVSFSADGKMWTDYPDNPVITLGSDTGQQAIYDPCIEKYVVYGRFGAGGRKVARAESDDFVKWSPPRLVMQADSNDGPRTQIYGMGITLYEGQYIGLPWMFYEGDTWKIDVQLATSRDGRLWTRVADRQIFLPNGPEGSWDEGILFTASQPAQLVGDKIFIFYSACRHDHDYTNRSPKGTPEWLEEWNLIKTSIGVATLRRDGFVSLGARGQPGTVVTKTFDWPVGKCLYVNANAEGGMIRVAVLDEQGKAIKGWESSQQTVGDQLRGEVIWSSGAPRSFQQPIRLQFTLRGAEIYSYWFE